MYTYPEEDYRLTLTYDWLLKDDLKLCCTEKRLTYDLSLKLQLPQWELGHIYDFFQHPVDIQ